MAYSLLPSRALLPWQSAAPTRSERSGTCRCPIVCSSMDNFTRRAGKFAFATVAATILVAGAANAQLRFHLGASDEEIKAYMDKALTYDQMMMRAYLDVKAKGTDTKCPDLTAGELGFKLQPGDYRVNNMCLQPTSYRVTRKAGIGNYDISTTYETRLITKVDGIEGSLAVSTDGDLKFEEKKGLDTGTTLAKFTARIPGKSELVPFMFGIQDLVASGKPENFGGSFVVPTATVQAGEDVENEPLEATKTEGEIAFKVTSSNAEARELAGQFETNQLSGLDLRSMSDAGFRIGNDEKKRVKVQGIWYAKLD